MTFADWHRLGLRDPAASAKTLLNRLTALPADQRRAIVAWSTPEPALMATIARQIAMGGPLAGVPFLVKDLFPVRGVPMHAGSSFLAEVRSTASSDSSLVKALETAGAVLGGTTHLHEFAYGLTGENVHWGDVQNPLALDRISGGSSSGSAAAVAAGIVPLALGTDTGGSIRVPASFCGLFGLRLTPHHPWIADAFPLAPSFDTAGWFTRTAGDMRRAVEALIGVRAHERPLRGVFLGFDDWVPADPDVATQVNANARRMAPDADAMTKGELLQVFRGTTEAYAILQSIEAFNVHRGWLDLHRDRYSSEVWQRIDRGRHWRAEQEENARIKLASVRLLWTKFFLTYDFLVLPATPFPALRKAVCTLENRNRLLALTTPASLGGLPVLTLPIPLQTGLSAGLQVVVNSATSPVISWALNQFCPDARPESCLEGRP